MNPTYAECWVSRPDVCRCCLSSNGTWDLTLSYTTENGTKEVYADMLQECYGITLSCILQWAPRMVCDLCLSQLRAAANFRKQVLLADKQYLTYCNDRLRMYEPITSESLPQTSSNNEDSKDVHEDLKPSTSPGMSSQNLEAEISDKKFEPPFESSGLDREATPENRVESMKLNSGPQADKEEDHSPKYIAEGDEAPYDSDQDIVFVGEYVAENPVAGMKRKQPIDRPSVILSKENAPESSNKRFKSSYNSCDLDSAVASAITSKSFFTRPQHIEKQVSERKRVILTSNIVLRDTNACPFRHHKSWFQCFFCQQDFMEMNPLRKHTVTKHSNIDDELKKIKRYPRSLQIEITNLECRHCTLKLTDVNSMRRHFLDVHEKIIYNECIADYKVNGTPYSCHLCEQQFHVFRSLTTHLNEHYANCICDVCGKSFLNSKRLKVHKRTHENGQFPCNECGKVLKTKTSKANHIESVHYKRIIKCQICYEPMKHYNDRIKHMSEVHDITHKFKCHICSREYNIKHYLATHIRQTHGNRNKKCLECGMAFITNHGLKKHMLKHTGVKPYTCNVCCKSYARSYTLKEHMRAHDNEMFQTPE